MTDEEFYRDLEQLRVALGREHQVFGALYKSNRILEEAQRRLQKKEKKD